MLLSYIELVKLVENGVINAKPELINGASIDVTLYPTIMVELPSQSRLKIELASKESLRFIEVEMKHQYELHPGQFILAATEEVFNLPNDIVCEFKLKSSIARAGLNHLFAGFCDPNWSNSRLTLELKNDTQFHDLILRPGMKIGQMVFYRVTPVPHEQSYAVKGHYNNTLKATASVGHSTGLPQ